MLWRLDAIGWLLLFGLLNAIAKPVLAWGIHDSDMPNAVSFLCACAGAGFWLNHRTALPMSRIQRIGLIGVTGLLLLPMAFAAWAAVAIIAVTLLLSKGLHRIERAGLLVLFAASIRTPIAEGTMILLAEPLLHFDGAFANGIGQLFGGGGTLNGNMIVGAQGHAVLIMSGCASFANVSNALLIWFSIAMLSARPKRGHLIATAVGLTFAIVFINAVRLGGMTVSRDAYLWIHEGNGALIAEAAMVAAILIALSITLRRTRHVA